MMLSNLAYDYEVKAPRLPLTTLVGLNVNENHLLAELGGRAKIIAPFLGKALTARIQEFVHLNAEYSMNNIDLQLYLQDWFLQLFHCREEKYIGFQEYFLYIPLNLVLIGIDLILTYGHEVTKFGPDSEMATQAFQKVLALKIASEQLQSQAQEDHHFYEMMLLD